MALVTSKNREQWMANEMARRQGKPPPSAPNPYTELSISQLKEQKSFIKQALKETKKVKEK